MNSHGAAGELQKEWIEAAHAAFAQSYDEEHGGFGGAPKFPRPSVLNFLLRGRKDSRKMAVETLRAMSRGGMRDQLGGGFHRYSVDRFWHVPHFEKMLYDQAQIAVSLAEAWQITKPRYLQAATRAAEFVRAELLRDGELIRSWRGSASDIPGFAEDYALFIQGLLDLYVAGFELQWMVLAVALQSRQDALFLDGGSYFSSRAGDPLVPLRMKEDYDGAEPSANSVSALNLLRLGRMLHDDSLEQKARTILAAHAVQMDRMPSAVPQMLVALDLALKPSAQAVVAGDREAAQPLLQELRGKFRPHAVSILLDLPEAVEFFSQDSPAVREMKMIDGKPALYECENFTCRTPVTSP